MKMLFVIFSHAFPPRVTTKLSILVYFSCVTGCAHPIYKAYDGPERSQSDVVTMYNSSRSAFWSFTDVYSVDNMRLKQPASAITALPGVHSYQVVVTRRSIAAIFFLKDGFYQESICGFMLDAAPGALIKLGTVDIGGLVSTNEHKVYNALLDIEERFVNTAPATRQVRVECASLDLMKLALFQRLEPILSEGFLCLGKSDCQAEGAACIKESGYSYGICSKP